MATKTAVVADKKVKPAEKKVEPKKGGCATKKKN
jgi:hypothetical protein